MKKILSICLIICLLCSLVGCTTKQEPTIQENLEVMNTLRIAYENVYLKDIVHVQACRVYSDGYSNYNGYDPNEEVEPEPSLSEDAMLCLDNREVEIWRNNFTNEHIRIRIDSNDSGVYSKGVTYQLKQNCVFEAENYDYKSYSLSLHRQQGKFVDLGASCKAGYSDVYYWNWANLVAFDSLFESVEVKDDSTYILSSKPIVWEDNFYTTKPVVITLLINKADLTFKTIQLECEDWIEVADFEFFTNEQKDVFYEQIPEEVLNTEPDSRALFTSPEDMSLEDGYVPFMYPYEHVKDMLKEENISELWTVVE